jgi:hypothetical protein
MTLDSWEAVVAHALMLPGTELGTYYRHPGVKVAANNRFFLNVGHEPESSFVLHFDPEMAEILKQAAPDTFWQSSHYLGTGAVLVRFDSPDPQRVAEAIARSRDHAATLKPPRKR